MERRHEIDEHVAEWAADRSRDEIYHAVQSHGTPAGPVRNVAEVLGWEQARGRGFFRELTHPYAGTLRYPTLPYLSSEMPWQGSAAPRQGEHDAEIARGLAPRESPAGDDEGVAAPLAGVRVLDFTWAWAGPQASLLLCMLGAEVIKVESHARLDHARVHTLTAGSLSGGIDESPVFNDLNLGKRSVTLNLGKPEARELVRQLASKSDIVLQNMRPGVLDRLGLGYEDLRKVRPDIIMLSSSAVGATGPESSYAGYAPTFACLSGVVSISGHPDEAPIALSGSVDLRVGTASAFAVLAALYQRRRTGRGQNIDLSSTEVMSAMIGEAFLGYELTGRLPERVGNRDESMAPHGCYRCRGEGEREGEWITIAVATEAEWQALCRVVDDPALARPEFASARLRHQSQDALDEIISRFTARLAREDAVEQLQRAGVAAAIVHNGASLARDPHVLARGVYETVDHPRMGTLKTVRPPWRLEGAATPCASPLIGEHNAYVLAEILGLSTAEIDALVEAEIVY
jgi:benzylsuccinate CoA-transferase BbsF subunit